MSNKDYNNSYSEEQSSRRWDEHLSEQEHESEITTFEEAQTEEIEIGEEKPVGKSKIKGDGSKVKIIAISAVIAAALGAGAYVYTTSGSSYEEENLDAPVSTVKEKVEEQIKETKQVVEEKKEEVKEQVQEKFDDFTKAVDQTTSTFENAVEKNDFSQPNVSNDSFNNSFETPKVEEVQNPFENQSTTNVSETVETVVKPEETPMVQTLPVLPKDGTQTQPQIQEQQTPPVQEVAMPMPTEEVKIMQPVYQEQLPSQPSSSLNSEHSEMLLSVTSEKLTDLSANINNIEALVNNRLNNQDAKIDQINGIITSQQKDIEQFKVEIEQLKNRIISVEEKPCNCDKSTLKEEKVVKPETKNEIKVVETSKTSPVKNKNFIEFVGKRKEAKLPDVVKTEIKTVENSKTFKETKSKINVSKGEVKSKDHIKSILSGIAWVTKADGTTETLTVGSKLYGKEIGSIDVNSGIYDTQGNKLLDLY